MEKRISIENIGLFESERLVNTPLSLEACRREGIAPEDLLYKPLEFFEQDNLGYDIQRLYFYFFKKTRENLIEIVKEKAAQDSTITFFDKEFGSPTCVDDVVEQVKNHLLPNPIAGVFHMTNAGGATWYDWAKEIVADLHLPVVVEKRTDTPTRAARIPQSTMLISTKLPPMRSWQEALRHYLASMSSRAND